MQGQGQVTVEETGEVLGAFAYAALEEYQRPGRDPRCHERVAKGRVQTPRSANAASSITARRADMSGRSPSPVGNRRRLRSSRQRILACRSVLTASSVVATNRHHACGAMWESGGDDNRRSVFVIKFTSSLE